MLQVGTSTCVFLLLLLLFTIYRHIVFISPVLDLLALARGTYALLHLPKMPELKGHDVSSFTPHPMAIDDIPYKDKSLKKQAEIVKAKKGQI